MHLLLLIFGIVLLPKAYTLKCYVCKDEDGENCIDTTIECPFQCAAQSIIMYSGDSKNKVMSMKTCIPPELCVDKSFNYGIGRMIFSSKCCTTDLCNAQTLPEPNSIPNGKKCNSCNGLTCTGTLNCEGNEDFCFSITEEVEGQTNTLKGCLSEVVCSDQQAAQMFGVSSEKISCCQGDFCNSGSNNSGSSTSTSSNSTITSSNSTKTNSSISTNNSVSSTNAGLLLLVAPLVSLVLFS